jgi:hypothetical protein
MQPANDRRDPHMETAMKTVLRLAVGSAAALVGLACADVGTTPSAAGSLAVFQSVPAGFSATSNTFSSSGDLGEAFQPHLGDGSFDDRGGFDDHGGLGEDHGRGRGRGPGGPEDRGRGRGDGFGFLMGGGIGPEFLGEIGFGRNIGRGPFHADSVGSNCVFASSTGLVTCGPVTNRGLTVLVTAAIKKTDGTAQSKIDSLTNSLTLHSEVSGTVTRRDSATSTISHKSDRSITGLAAGSTQRTVNGTAVGTETTTGVTDAGAFKAIRTVNDTTTGVIVPLADGKPTFPSAGRVSRNKGSAVTIDGTTTTHTRSEVVTYDGSAVAKVVITQDGVAKNCTMALPRGHLVCE